RKARKDATQVVANLQRQQVNSRLIASDYLEAKDLMDVLIAGCVLESQHMKKFFDYIQLPNFDISADAAATFKFLSVFSCCTSESAFAMNPVSEQPELLTRHKSTVAEFLSRNYDWLFAANQNKPPDIFSILVANKSKLLRLFADFKTDKEDERLRQTRLKCERNRFP
ncbi:MO25-like protein At2g03410, partial [Hibiscus syriacus]|uniref:MO25-like protein At2g03410 n=1 Tax=Hibiscus syriacus TaxID=106335 RepID=UPI0019222A52